MQKDDVCGFSLDVVVYFRTMGIRFCYTARRASAALFLVGNSWWPQTHSRNSEQDLRLEEQGCTDVGVLRGQFFFLFASSTGGLIWK